MFFYNKKDYPPTLFEVGRQGPRAGRGGGHGFLSEQRGGVFGMGLRFLCKLVSSLLFKTWHMDGLSASSTGSS